MKKAKRILTVLSVALIMSLVAVLFTACRTERPGKQLDKPQNLRVNPANLILQWDFVEGNEEYVLEINGNTFTTVGTAYGLMNLNPLPLDAHFEIKIKATASNRVDSEWAEYDYRHTPGSLSAIELESFENNTLSWKAVPDALSYKVKAGSQAETKIQNTSFTLPTTSGALTVRIIAEGDGAYYSDSPALLLNVNASHTSLVMGSPDTFKVTEGVYNENKEFIPLDQYNGTAENTFFILEWNEISNAQGYMVMDIKGTVTTVTDARVDITDMHLPKAVMTLSANDIAQDGDYSTVKINYLQGSGTEAKPYLIYNYFNFRCIEYYETLFGASYYRIENDIAIQPRSRGLFFNAYSQQLLLGKLDGNDKVLSNIDVDYDGGYWSMFDLLGPDAEICDLTVKDVKITSLYRKPDLPINSAVAVICHTNLGTISNVHVENAELSANGEVCGIVGRNEGTVDNCSVENSSMYTQKIDFSANQMHKHPKFEIAGIAIENKGTIKNCIVDTVDLGKQETKDYSRNVGGIASINRVGAKILKCDAKDITIIAIANNAQGENGAIAGYSGGDITYKISGCTLNGIALSGNGGAVSYNDGGTVSPY